MSQMNYSSLLLFHSTI